MQGISGSWFIRVAEGVFQGVSLGVLPCCRHKGYYHFFMGSWFRAVPTFQGLGFRDLGFRFWGLGFRI